MTQITELVQELTPEQREVLNEAVDYKVRQMLAVEDQGWLKITGNFTHDEEGLSLSTLKEMAELARDMAVGSPLIKRAITLRHSYVWSKPLSIPGVNDSPLSEDKRGRKSKLEKFVNNPVNQRNVFGPAATPAMESALATESMFLLLGDNTTKELRPVPIDEISAVYTNPDFADEIWAYQREWNSVDGQGKLVTRKAWIYTDRYPGSRKKPVDRSAQDSPGHVGTDSDKTFLDMSVNRQVGWPFGVPDVVSALYHARSYIEMVQDGKAVSSTLAAFAAKVKAKSKTGADNVGVKVSNAQAGSVASYAEGNDIDIFSSAGRTYNFDGIRPVAALVAAAMEVSIVHLLSDPGAAGSSYGSAANLDLPTKRAMVARQNLWGSFLERVIMWGVGEKVYITFPPLEEPDMYRQMQAARLATDSGLLHDDERRKLILSAAGINPMHAEPPEQPVEEPDATPAAQQAAPDQGKGNGTGGDEHSGEDLKGS